jgi:hypothetical protein
MTSSFSFLSQLKYHLPEKSSLIFLIECPTPLQSITVGELPRLCASVPLVDGYEKGCHNELSGSGVAWGNQSPSAMHSLVSFFVFCRHHELMFMHIIM